VAPLAAGVISFISLISLSFSSTPGVTLLLLVWVGGGVSMTGTAGWTRGGVGSGLGSSHAFG